MLANYTLDEEDDASKVCDHSLRRNHLVYGDGDSRPTSNLSTAPISDDTAQVRSALAGVNTTFHELIHSRPAIAEYADVQYDSNYNMTGVFKRCYGYIKNGEWRLITGYKVGNLVTEWIGQVQFDPQIVGFIEGAPPLPSENMTAGPVSPSVPMGYMDSSNISAIEADQVSYTISSSKESGFMTSFDAAADLTAGGKTSLVFAPVGFGVTMETAAKFTAGVKAELETELGWSNQESLGIGSNVTKSLSVSQSGNWEDPENKLNTAMTRRWLPINMGIALVESETADLFALRLEHNQALVAFRFQPNPDIPKDVNIISFPINLRYIKQGTLDGGVGFDENGSKVLDSDYPMAADYGEYSFFKPVEAYTLKRRIKQEEQQLLSYYQNFDTAPVGAQGMLTGGIIGAIAGGAATIGGLPFGAALGANIGGLIEALRTDPSLPGMFAQRDIVNTYVWTADGGLYEESTETTDVKQETKGGSYSFTGKGTFSLSSEFSIAGTGVSADMNAMFGGKLSITKSKSEEASQSFSITVKADPPGDLQAYNEDDLTRVYDAEGNAVTVPGKVDAYRFMTFYLAENKENFEDLFNKVVNPIWLEQSNHPNALAMRQANQSASRPPCWRVLHRVTFVSRILPDYPPDTEATVETAMKAEGIESNWQLIQILNPFLKNKTDDAVKFGDALHAALTTYLPELLPHEQQVLEYMMLYYGVEV